MTGYPLESEALAVRYSQTGEKTKNRHQQELKKAFRSYNSSFKIYRISSNKLTSKAKKEPTGICLAEYVEFYKGDFKSSSHSARSNLKMDSEKFMLSIADYIMFAALLAVSAGIGVFFIFKSKKNTNDEYLLAGKDMSILPVAFSLMATFMSATTLMGIPAEMYLYGTNMAFMNIGFIIGPIITSYIFLPIYFANDISTAYEYLEKRFGKTTRKITSAMFVIQNLLFTSATLYAPALALSAVTSLSSGYRSFQLGWCALSIAP
ncbi:Sodium-coupled monocarboxylate transporter 1 like protein [Argiope bruennichi]|uniref:Sodium-coupled monocarboxylate transporter 1 like protein n=1 Tax=Argiope bruennichi TaxID=94029 RepID=A0A8T0E0R9_ARGBR|nr:Sodium-coupled monocarboxylate transporter 1 like protein [Argiope bruennichi]